MERNSFPHLTATDPVTYRHSRTKAASLGLVFRASAFLAHRVDGKSESFLRGRTCAKRTCCCRAACLAAAWLATSSHAQGERDLGQKRSVRTNGWAGQRRRRHGRLCSCAGTDLHRYEPSRADRGAEQRRGIRRPLRRLRVEPKIIYVKGTIDANVDDDENKPLACTDYYRDGYTLKACLPAYDPGCLGSRSIRPGRSRTRASPRATRSRIACASASARTRRSSASARTRSSRAPGSTSAEPRTSPNSRTNIIIRNLTFRDTYDCFPAVVAHRRRAGLLERALRLHLAARHEQRLGRSQHLRGSSTRRTRRCPHYFGVLFQVHDGLLDITNASDLVTVSWNRFRNHDKTMLIGSSDSGTTAATIAASCA